MALPISYSSEEKEFIRQRILKGDVPQQLYTKGTVPFVYFFLCFLENCLPLHHY